MCSSSIRVEMGLEPVPFEMSSHPHECISEIKLWLAFLKCRNSRALIIPSVLFSATTNVCIYPFAGSLVGKGSWSPGLAAGVQARV